MQAQRVEFFSASVHEHTLPISRVRSKKLDEALEGKPSNVQRWVEHTGFKGAPGEVTTFPNEQGMPGGVLVGVSEIPSVYDYAALSAVLPPARYVLSEELSSSEAEIAALGWGLSLYRFDRYRKPSESRSELSRPELVWPQACDASEVERQLEGVFLTRDLINTPAEDMGPSELASQARNLAERHGAQCTVISGDELLEQGYPTIHMVGRAAADAPRLIDMRWGEEEAPRVTLVGKGVCFDSGGLDIKPAGGMLLMKKDMGGAAIVLGLAHALMSLQPKIRLRVLIPAVENAVSNNSFRPLDVVRTRSGLTVEVGNTDAEGRLILSDALTEAASENPDILFDFATLTGAARVALGTELPALFSNSDSFAEELLAQGQKCEDPYWRMPLHEPYRKQLESRVADLSNVGGRFGGAITAALFLQNFVKPEINWAHVDVMAWNAENKPGRPVGGEAMGLRSAYKTLSRRYSEAV